MRKIKNLQLLSLIARNWESSLCFYQYKLTAVSQIKKHSEHFHNQIVSVNQLDEPP